MKEGKSMYFNIEFPNKMAHAYSVMCKPLCQKMKLPQTAFDILMFLSNNTQYKTARDIVEVRKIKANLVSINVDKLVKEGYLERREVAGDRRKIRRRNPHILSHRRKRLVLVNPELLQIFSVFSRRHIPNPLFSPI